MVEVGRKLAMSVGGLDEVGQRRLAEIKRDVQEVVSSLLTVV